MTDDQELIRELGKLGYEAHMKDDVVQIVIDPEDFISGHRKLRADLDRLGWDRSYSYKPSRPLTPEEKEAWERNTDPFPELRSAANRQQPAARKQQHPAQSNREAAQKQQHPAHGSSSAAYKARMAAGAEAKKARTVSEPEGSGQIPGQMDIFQFLGGAV